MKKIIFMFLLVCLLMPGLAMAQGQTGGGNTNTGTGGSVGGGNGNTGAPNPNIIKPIITNPLKAGIGNDIPSIIAAVMKGIVMPLASVLVVLAILYSGFKFVIAQGNPTEIQKARDGLVWVLVGSAILLGAYGISEVLKTTVNQVVGTSV